MDSKGVVGAGNVQHGRFIAEEFFGSIRGMVPQEKRKGMFIRTQLALEPQAWGRVAITSENQNAIDSPKDNP